VKKKLGPWTIPLLKSHLKTLDSSPRRVPKGKKKRPTYQEKEPVSRVGGKKGIYQNEGSSGVRPGRIIDPKPKKENI